MAAIPTVLPEVNAAAFYRMLRSIWDAQPSLAGARALIALLAKMVEQCNKFAAQLNKDRFQRAALRTWHDDLRRAVGRLDAFADAATQAFMATQPETIDRISMLASGVVGPILNGVYPVGFADAQACLDAGGVPSIGCDIAKSLGLPCGEGLGGCNEREILLRRGLKHRADGTWKGMGEAFEVASLWNRIVAAWAADAQVSGEVVIGPGLLTDSLRDWMSQVQADLSTSAPGEAPTTFDKIGGAIDKAKETVGDIVKAATAGLRIAVYAGVGAVVVIGAYLLLRK